jgi:excisionase family DNA binding protein
MEVSREYLTVDDVAVYLGCSRRTVYRYMDRGLESRLIGGMRRVSLSDLRSWIEQQGVAS